MRCFDLLEAHPPSPSTGWPGHYGRILEPRLMRISVAMASGDHCDAADKLYATILRRETTLEIARGTVWVVDNHRCCHGRTELHEGLRSKRHLIRLYCD
jgi:Taurine catabolism dioxygenase TauD, TfdA family